LAALFFFTLAGFGSGALGALDLFARAPDPSFLFGALAFFVFAQTRVRERMRARVAFVLGEGAQHHAGRFRRHCRSRSRRTAALAGCPPTRRRSAGLDGCPGTLGRSGSVGRRCLGFGLAWSRNAAFDLLDHDGLAAAMTEALAHHSLLNAAAL